MPRDERAEVWQTAVARSGGQPAPARVVAEVIEERAAASLGSDDEDERASALFTNFGPKAPPPPTRIVNHGTSLANERYTPVEYIEAARRVLGAIDVDPASCSEANATVGARQFWTIETNGLDREWPGRVWLNPPYGVDEERASNAGRWAARLVEQYVGHTTTAAILCVNALPYAPWFQPLWDFCICFTNHRVNFPKPVGSEPDKSGPANGTAFIYMGPDRESFIREFSKFGAVVTRLHPIGNWET